MRRSGDGAALARRCDGDDRARRPRAADRVRYTGTQCAGLVTAALLSMVLTGCGGSSASDDGTDTGSTDTGSTDTGSTAAGSTDPGSTDSGTTGTADAVPEFDDLKLEPFWQLALLGCDKSEDVVPQNAEVAKLVTVCKPHATSDALRLINVSVTSVRVTHLKGTVHVNYQRHAKDDPLTSAVVSALDAGYRELTPIGIYEAFILPTGDSALVAPSLAGGTLVPLSVSTEPEAGQRALYGRAAAQLFGKLPWDKLGDLDAASAKVAGCVLDALARVQQQQVADDLKDAFDAAKGCQDAAQELAEKWHEQTLAAPEASALLDRIGQEAAAADGVAGEVARILKGNLSVLERRL